MDELIFDLAEAIDDPETFAYVITKLSVIKTIDWDLDVFEGDEEDE
jgi:hypothetical protein